MVLKVENILMCCCVLDYHRREASVITHVLLLCWDLLTTIVHSIDLSFVTVVLEYLVICWLLKKDILGYRHAACVTLEGSIINQGLLSIHVLVLDFQSKPTKWMWKTYKVFDIMCKCVLGWLSICGLIIKASSLLN